MPDRSKHGRPWNPYTWSRKPHKKKQGRGLSRGVCRLTDLCSRISGHIHETCRNAISAPKSSHNFKGCIALASGRPEEGSKDEKGARFRTIWRIHDRIVGFAEQGTLAEDHASRREQSVEQTEPCLLWICQAEAITKTLIPFAVRGQCLRGAIRHLIFYKAGVHGSSEETFNLGLGIGEHDFHWG